MSKVICDVCGTTYPETATQCPICNSAKNSQTQTASGTDGEEIAASGYERTKGGRFSKKNVRSRTRKAPAAPQRRSSSSPDKEEEPSSTGLVVVVVLLLVAIIAVLIYIGVQYFRNNQTDFPEDTKNNPVVDTSGTGTENTKDPYKIPCESVQLSNAYIELSAKGDSWSLVVQLSPVDTTDSPVFTSSNEAVATVSEDGTITAVGYGEAVITATCGEVTATCTVKCTFDPPETKPTDPPAVELVFEWNTPYTDETTGYGDTTLIKAGTTWRAYKNSLNVSPGEITWSSDNPDVCTIDNGIVTAVSPGTTKIHAQYNGVTYTCYVRCKWRVEETTAPTESSSAPTESGSDTTDPSEGSSASTDPSEGGSENPAPEVTYTISHEDVSIAIGETFYLKLKDSDGNTVDVVWTVDKEGYISIEGNKITGVQSLISGVVVSTEYEGKTYTCIVRVKSE